MPRYYDARRIRALQLDSLRDGGRQTTFAKAKRPSEYLTRTVEWDVSGNCQSPVFVELHGRPEIRGNTRTQVVGGPDRANFMRYEVPCRKCEKCLARRGYHWGHRAIAEYRSAPRTWLVTLTINPENVNLWLSRCRSLMAKQGIDYDALDAHEQFLQLEALGYAEFQKRVKLLRKTSEVPIRYLCITEAHKSGLPHWHVLMHESDPDRPLRYDPHFSGFEWDKVTRRKIRKCDPFWKAGFLKASLVDDPKGARYVCKYLGKSISARVRASKYYGTISGVLMPSPTEASSQAKRREERVKPPPEEQTK